MWPELASKPLYLVAVSVVLAGVILFPGTGEPNSVSESPSISQAAPTQPAAIRLADRDALTSASTQANEFTPEMLFVLGLILIASVLFVWEPIRLDLIALALPVVLIISKPLTGMSISQALSGFSNPATITVLAMFILSEGVRRSGAIQILGDRLSEYVGSSDIQQVSVVSGISGAISGFIPNTPVVAMFIPMVTELANKVKTSPSKLLIPLSYASMLGGMLTLIGTSTNILASDVSARLLGHPFTMFEFLPLGLIVLVSGMLYLIFVAPYLLPERLEPGDDLTVEYEMSTYLTEVVVSGDSVLTGKTVDESMREIALDVDLVQITREGKQFMEPLDEKTLRKGDRLVLRSKPDTLMELRRQEGLYLLPAINVTERKLEKTAEGQQLIEVVIPRGSFMEGQTLAEANFPDRYDATVLAVRRGETVTHVRMDEMELTAGDVLLLHATDKTLNRLRNNRNFIIAQEFEETDYRTSKMPYALGIMVTLVVLVALNVMEIVTASLAGVLAMIFTECLEPGEMYEAVNWQVIILLAGLIPLGIAMEITGLARFLAGSVIDVSFFFPPIVVVGLFYLFTALLTNIISNNASVVLMIPVAVDAASQLGTEPFPFVLAVTFAASTAFLTPIGYQTNLMVYGSGGYKFRDFMIVGFPLQLLLTVVTPVGIALIWGV